MDSRTYPFRFYGREPADWSPPESGFVYELEFASPLEYAQKARLALAFEQHFQDGPAAALPAPWWWSGDRFAVCFVGERFRDAPRMVFGAVAQFLVEVHRFARLADVVFSNGVGARADRWDAWSLSQQLSPDAGPARPEARFAQVLQRPEDESLAPYAVDEAFESARAEARTAHPPRATRAAKKASPAPAGEPEEVSAPEPSSPASGAGRSSSRRAPGVALEAVDPALYPPPEPWMPTVFARPESDKADGDHLVPGLRLPVARVMRGGRWVGLAALDGDQQRVETLFPEGVTPDGAVAVDEDGLRALVASGNAIYEVPLPGGSPRYRMGVHLNNGPITGIAWTTDDLWAVVCTQQLLVDDLKDVEVAYVGAVRLYYSAALSSARHGTVLLAKLPGALSVVGVSAWQLKELGRLHGELTFSHEVQGEVIVKTGSGLARLSGLDEAYEHWAAPLREREESTRKKRFASSKSKRPATKPRWRYVEAATLPPDGYRATRAKLRERYGLVAWFGVSGGGAAVVVTPLPNQSTSRAALLRWVDREGVEVDLGESVAFAAQKGVTNLSITPDERHFFVVDGHDFNVVRVSVEDRTSVPCQTNAFVRPGGLLFDVVALDQDNLVALWVDGLDWHRRDGDGWTKVETLRLKGARGVAFDAAKGRLAVLSQDRHRLLVVSVRGGRFELEAKFLDPVKLASFREGRLYAQMTDGVWFVLEGLPDAPVEAP